MYTRPDLFNGCHFEMRILPKTEESSLWVVKRAGAAGGLQVDCQSRDFYHWQTDWRKEAWGLRGEDTLQTALLNSWPEEHTVHPKNDLAFGTS